MIILHFDLQPQFTCMNYFIYTSQHFISKDTNSIGKNKEQKRCSQTRHDLAIEFDLLKGATPVIYDVTERKYGPYVEQDTRNSVTDICHNSLRNSTTCNLPKIIVANARLFTVKTRLPKPGFQ